jgi:hypothetical protein
MDRSLSHTLLVITLGLGLLGLHHSFGLGPSWLVVSLPAALLLGAWWSLAGRLTGALVQRRGQWWPRRSPCLGGGSRLADASFHLRDLADFLHADWTLAALVLGGCALGLSLAPFCLLAWWLGVCRASA